MRRWILLLCAFLFLAACSKDKDVDKPAALVPFSATLKVNKVWSAKVGDKKSVVLRLGLGLGVEGARVYAAGRKGEVAAFDLSSGHQIWHVRTKTQLSGGTGVGDGLVIVGTSKGQVIALHEKDGATAWKVHVDGEILAPPAISEHLIVLRTVDGKLHGLAPTDGHELWAQDQQVPRLSLRGTATPVFSGDLVLCGFDNGKVVALNAGDGSVQWETTVSPAHGRTELERLVDIDSAVDVSGGNVYAVGFQGRVAMLKLDTGQVWWSHDASSYHGLGLDDDSLYMASADGNVVALRKGTGAELWRQKALQYRRLSSPGVSDASIIVGDYKGYVHWIDKATGGLQARASTSKVSISQAPIVNGNMVIVINDAGAITAFRTTPIAGAKTVAPPSPPPAPAAQKDNVAAPSTPADQTVTPAKQD
jgi:outer membrane protein assembly factor BamB